MTNGSPFGASHTFEYAFSAAAAAQFAKSLGHQKTTLNFRDYPMDGAICTMQ
jgi:putative alpha-1,2-mannosidase